VGQQNSETPVHGQLQEFICAHASSETTHKTVHLPQVMSQNNQTPPHGKLQEFICALPTLGWVDVSCTRAHGRACVRAHGRARGRAWQTSNPECMIVALVLQCMRNLTCGETLLQCTDRNNCIPWKIVAADHVGCAKFQESPQAKPSGKALM
jgi:hypothetical protein